MLVLCCVSVVLASDIGVDEIYFNSGWSRGDNVSPAVSYTSVAHNTRHTYADSFLGACSDGGIRESYYDGGWDTSDAYLT
ncbi:MAG: hypothetical protein JXA11_05785, partial [Phycisphaerae bacterium]|nr:hypothetical protein [Phycisphaerae bacterium]